MNRITTKNALSVLLQFIALSVFLASSAQAQDPFGGSDDEFLPVEQAYQVLVQTSDDKLIMDWKISPGYYLYQHQFAVEARNVESSEKLSLNYEPGLRKFDEYFGKELETYYEGTQVLSSLPQMAAPYELVLTSQGCADAGLCYPPRKQYFSVEKDGIILELSEAQFTGSNQAANSIDAESADLEDAAAETGSRSSQTTQGPSPSIIATLLSAILGGLILNLMPCVFPVLSLKALSIASSNHSAKKQQLHGWAYTAGVVGSFIIAAAVIIVAREAGSMLGWGFQLQQPIFVGFMAYLFLVMGLMLSGMFTLGGSLMGAGQNLTSGNGLRASFFTGVLAALVASPCTAPFMATALGVALTQPIPIAILIFAALGFGMALPFILLSYMPALADKLPAPGPWMETLKQLLAFPLYATVVWLLWVFGNQTSGDGAALLALGGVMLSFAIWLFQQTSHSGGMKLFTRALAFSSALIAILLVTNASKFSAPKNSAVGGEHWQAYSNASLQELRSQGKPVFVNLTADWCITCKVNERVALSSDSFFKAAERLGVTLVKGDWTNADAEISDLLEKHGRNGVPMYLMYPNSSSEPEILPQILTTGLVIEAMQRATQ